MIKNILLVMGFTAARLGNPELPEAHLGEAPLPPLRKLLNYKNKTYLYHFGYLDSYEGEANYKKAMLRRETAEKDRQAFDEAAFKKHTEFQNEARQEKEHQMAAYADAEKRYKSQEKLQAELVAERKKLPDAERVLDAEPKGSTTRKRKHNETEKGTPKKEHKRGTEPKKERTRETETGKGTKPKKERKKETEEPKEIKELIKALDRARKEPNDAKTIELINVLIEWRESAQTLAQSEMDDALRIAEQAMYSETAAANLLAEMEVALDVFKAAEPSFMEVEGHLRTARRNYNKKKRTEASVDEAREAHQKAWDRRRKRIVTYTELARKEIPRWGEANSPRAKIPDWDGIEQRMANEWEMKQPIPFGNRPARRDPDPPVIAVRVLDEDGGREMLAVIEGFV